MPLLAPIEMRVNVKNQQPGHQQYDQYRGVRPVPHAYRQGVPVIDLPFGRVFSQFHWRNPSKHLCRYGESLQRHYPATSNPSSPQILVSSYREVNFSADMADDQIMRAW